MALAGRTGLRTRVAATAALAAVLACASIALAAPDAYAQFTPPVTSTQYPVPLPHLLPQAYVVDEDKTVGHPYPVALHRPTGIAFDSEGRLLVVDSDSARVSVFNTPSVSTVNASSHFGSKGSNFVGEPARGMFNQPLDLDVGENNYTYVIDQLGNRVQIFDRDGAYVDQVPPRRTQFVAADGAFFGPTAIAVHGDMFYVGELQGRVQAFHAGNNSFAYKIGAFGQTVGPNTIYSNGLGANGTHIFVADSYNGRVSVYAEYANKSGADFAYSIDLPSVYDHVDPQPADVEIDGTTMYVSDFSGHRVYAYDLADAPAPITNETKMIGEHGRDAGDLRNPESIAVRGGLVYVSDSGYGRIMAYNASTGMYANVTLGGEPHAADELSGPYYIRVSGDGSTLLVSDTGNAQVKEFVLNASTGTYGNRAAFADHVHDPNFFPTGIAVDDGDGRVYVLDHYRSGLYVFNSTLGLVGTSDLEGTTRGSGIALDDEGRLVVTSVGSGNVSTYERNGSYVSHFYAPSPIWPGLPGGASPSDVEINEDGNLVVAEHAGQGVSIRDRDGSILHTIDANPFYLLYLPGGVAVDQNGRIIVANSGASTIHVYDHAGGFVTRVGSHGEGPGQFVGPQDVDVFGNGTLAVADNGNHRVQFLNPADTTPPTILSVTFGGILGTPTGLYPYGPGGLIVIDVKFSEDIRTFTRAGGERPSIMLETGEKDGRAVLFGTGAEVYLPADTVRFLYTVSHGEASFALDYAEGNPFDLGDGAITDLHGNRADLTVPPAGSEGSLSGAASMELVRRSNPFTLAPAALFYGAGHVLGGVNVAGGPTVVQEIGTPYSVEMPSPEDVAISPDGALLFVSVKLHDSVRVYNAATGEYLLQIGGKKDFYGRILNNPEGIAINSTGHLFIAESGHSRVSVYNPDGTPAYMSPARFDPSGANPSGFPTNTFGTYDFTNGSGSLQFPTGVAIGADGMIYVADQGHGRVEVFNPDWTPSHFLGATGDVRLSEPLGLGYDRTTGRLLVADPREDRTLVFENPGSPDGNSIAAVIRSPGQSAGATPGTSFDVAVDSTGRVLVANHADHTIDIYERNATGYERTGAVNASVGGNDGELFSPAGMAFGSNGKLYVADSANDRVKVFAFGAGSPSGAFERTIGEDTHDPSEFAHPFDADARDGRLAVADTENDRVVVFDTNSTGQYAYNFTIGGDGEHPLSVSLACRGASDRDCRGPDDGEMVFPSGVAIGADGSIYVSDYGNHRLKIFDSNGAHVRTIYEAAGMGVSYPSKIDTGEDGRVFFVDSGNHRIAVLSAAGEGLYAFGSQGSGPGQFERPSGIAVGPDGRVAVSDTFNRRVQVFEADGTYVETVGGPRTYDYPNPGELNLPHGVEVDKDGRIIVVDARTNRLQIYGPGGASAYTFDSIGDVRGSYDDPYGVAIDDRTGNIVVVDSGNSRLQVLTFSDTTAPRAVSASAAPVPGAAAAGSEGSAVAVSVTFDEPVRVNRPTVGSATPSIQLNSGPWASAVYTSGSGTDTLSFMYTVRAGEMNATLDFADSRIMVPTKAYIADIWGNAADASLSGLSLAGAGISIDAAPAGQLRIGLLVANASSPLAQAALLGADDYNSERAAGSPPLALSLHEAGPGGAAAALAAARSGGSGPSVFVSTLPDSELALASGDGQSAYAYAAANGLAILSTSPASAASAALTGDRFYSLAPTAIGLAEAVASQAAMDNATRAVVAYDASGSRLHAPTAAALRSLIGDSAVAGAVDIGGTDAPAAEIGRMVADAESGTAVVYLGSAASYAGIAPDVAGAARSAQWYAAGTEGGTSSGSIAASPVFANSPPALSLASKTMLKVVSFAPAPTRLSGSLDERLALPAAGSSQGAYAAYDAVRVAGAAAAAEGSSSNATAVGMQVRDAARGYAGALGTFALQAGQGGLMADKAYATWTVSRTAEWERMGLSVDPRCSVGLGMPNMEFGNVNIGETSDSRMQRIINTGTVQLSSVTADATVWSFGSTQFAANLTGYRMSEAGQFMPIMNGTSLASDVDAGVERNVQFQVNLSGVSVEQGGMMSQTIIYTATCG